MTIAENLELGAFVYRSEQAERDAALSEPMTYSRVSPRRGTGGVPVGRDTADAGLGHRSPPQPEVLMIDELSLGLAPVVVQDLIGVVERLEAEGLTLIIVEQSLNVAGAIADRAVFLERGRVSFDGPIRELMERDDLARAVFLGGRQGGMMLAVSGSTARSCSTGSFRDWSSASSASG